MSASTPSRKTLGELLLLSPIEVGGPSLSSSPRKRQITPLTEKMSPKRLAVITGPGAVSPVVNNVVLSTLPNPLRWPIKSDLAYIESRSSLYETIPNPLLQSESAQVRFEPPRHIILPFDLRDDEDALYDSKKRDLLFSIFPATVGVSTDGLFISLQVTTLPPKPWPLTVAGLPLYLPTQIGQNPRPKAKPALLGNGSIAEDQNGRDMEDWVPLFNVIKDHFQDVGVSITEVVYFSDSVYIVLEHRNTDPKRLPRLAARIRCYYMFEDEMGRPSTPQARRSRDPAPGDPDITEYDTLQPGLRVSSGQIPGSVDASFGTTTGVLIKDQNGTQFMTVAAHGFPSKCGTSVFHSSSTTGRDIGELIMEVSHTDIALVHLHKGEKFDNVMFQNDTVPDPVQLTKLAPSRGYKRRSIVYIDSPDTGFIEGDFVVQSFQRIPNEPGVPEQSWLTVQWYYTGQDSGADLPLPEGMCGSAIWDTDGNVLGLFYYAVREGLMADYCCGIAADELIDRGFTLVDTSP